MITINGLRSYGPDNFDAQILVNLSGIDPAVAKMIKKRAITSVIHMLTGYRVDFGFDDLYGWEDNALEVYGIRTGYVGPYYFVSWQQEQE